MRRRDMRRQRPVMAPAEKRIIWLLAGYYRGAKEYTCAYPIEVTTLAQNTIIDGKIDFEEVGPIQNIFKKFLEFTAPNCGERLKMVSHKIIFVDERRYSRLFARGFIGTVEQIDRQGWASLPQMKFGAHVGAEFLTATFEKV